MNDNNLEINSPKVHLFIGTRKGAFILSSDAERKNWHFSEILFKSWNVMHMTLDQRDSRLHAAVHHDVYGPSTHYSDDLEETRLQASQLPSFSRPSRSGRPPGTPDEVRTEDATQQDPEKVLKIWNITPGRISQPGMLYAGVEPAALFVSSDRGETWQINDSLFDHPHRADWFPGAGGLALHTILPHPQNESIMYVAISAGGCYKTEDGGKSWSPRNNNVRADFMPEKYPQFGQCANHMAFHPDQPEVIYQQNHCGTYRSDNAGDYWIDIGEGRLPSRFGFPIAVHPHEAGTIYVVLEESDEYRLSLGGQFAVWRSRDAGETWERLSQGLPKRASLAVLRQAIATDTLDNTGIYIGTSTGQIFYSRNSGDTWDLLADFLPPILSLEAAVLG